MNPPGAPPRRRRARLIAIAAALLGLVGGLLVTTTVTANAADTLLSQGKPVTASSAENAGTAAGNAVDGNTGTRWSSAFSDPQWIQVDLGATFTISQVVLQWEAAYATAYQLQTSSNGTTWTTVYSTTTSTGGTQTLAVSGSGRYVRMNGTARATQYGYSLWEFQVYGVTTGGGCTTTVAPNRPITVSSQESAGTPGTAAMDGNPGTRWSSAFSDPQWIQIDLGSNVSVCQVVLQWEAAYATAFQIQLSPQATVWTTIYSTTTGTGGTQTLNVSGTGRYLRVMMTARATPYGYSLWEITVRTGTPATSQPPTSNPPTSNPPTSNPPTSNPPTSNPPTSNPPGDRLLSYNKPATASTFQNEGACVNCTAAKAVDNDPATRWATSSVNGWVDPGWIYVDLGATATIHSVVLQWDPAYATAYQIQVSPNASTWTTIYTTTTSTGFKQTINGLNGSGRYVRMYGTARSNGYGYSLWEFQVYGTGGAPTTPPALPPNVSFPASRLVFGDEFNGAANSTPDASKWFAETGPGVNNELQYYTNNNNARMDGAGSLVIEARREVTAGSSCPGGPCQYTSGRINTSRTFTFTYGRVEARIKVSGTQGLWPAFWLLGANFSQVSWPACGEIDIMEHVGKEANRVYSTLHAPAYFGGGGAGTYNQITGDFAAAFHTYAVEWNQTHMTFFVDGNAFLTWNKSDIEATRGPWVFDHPFFIILNNAVGGDWPGPPDATTVLPQRMAIDYVRVYQ
jgi:beta-glucanase (GH16 family)